MPHHPLRLSLAGLMASALLTLPFSGLSFAATYSATAPTIGTGSLSDPYQISTPDQLVWMDQHASGSSDTYDLTANIDLTGYTGWVPITGFTGTFNGQDHTISNLTTDIPVNSSATSQEELGMFGDIGPSGTVTALTVTGWTSDYTGSTAIADLGLIADNNTGTITHVSVTGTITSDAPNVGMISGTNQGTLNHASANGDLTTTNTSAAVGGMIGDNSGGYALQYDRSAVTITADTDHAAGGVVGTTSGVAIDDALFSGTLTNTGNHAVVGGIVATNNATISGVAVTGSVAATGNATTVGGITGINFGGITESGALGSVQSTGSPNSIGDAVGDNNGGITSSFSTGPLTATDSGSSNIGGFIGINSTGTSALSDYSTSPITLVDPLASNTVGGFAGYNGGSITTAFAASQMHLNGAPSTIIGGFLGSNGGSVTNTYSLVNSSGIDRSIYGAFLGVNNEGSTIASSYYDATLTGTAPAVGNASVGGMTAEPTTAFLNGTVATNLATTHRWAGGADGLPMILGMPGGPEVSRITVNPLYLNQPVTVSGIESIVGIPTPDAPVVLTPLVNVDQVPGTPTLIWTAANGTFSQAEPPWAQTESSVSYLGEFSTMVGRTTTPQPVSSIPATVGLTLNTTPTQGPTTVTATATVTVPAGVSAIVPTTDRLQFLINGVVQTAAPINATTHQAQAVLKLPLGSITVAAKLIDPTGTFTSNTATLSLTLAPAGALGLSVSHITDSSAQMTWDAVYGATGYTVTLNGKPLASNPLSATTATLSQLTPATTNQVTVAAVYDGLVGTSQTVTLNTLPSPLSGLTVTATSPTSATASWSAVYGAQGYTVTLNGTPLPSNPILGTTTLLSGLTPATTNTVSVAAVYGAQSGSLQSATVNTPPTAPTQLAVTATSPTSATVTWTPVPRATQYRVTVMPPGVSVTTTTANTLLTHLPAGSTISVNVVADYDGSASASTHQSVTLPPAIVTPPPTVYLPPPVFTPPPSAILVVPSTQTGSTTAPLPHDQSVTITMGHVAPAETVMGVFSVATLPSAFTPVSNLVGIYQVVVEGPTPLADPTVDLSPQDTFSITLPTVLPIGSTLQWWDLKTQAWVVAATVTTAYQTTITAALPHRLNTDYVISSPAS